MNSLKKTAAVLALAALIFPTSALTGVAYGAPAAQQQGAGQNNQNGQFQGRRFSQFNIKPVLDKLVKAKTISAAQENKIIAYENKQQADRQAQMKKMQTMTQEQRQQYFQKQQKNGRQGSGMGRGNQYADLVKNKTITQKQADAISKAVAAARPNFGNRGGNGNWNGNGNNNGNSNGN